MALGSHLITVRRLEKYINDVIGKKANLPDTSKTIIGNISQINSDLSTKMPTIVWANPSSQSGTSNSFIIAYLFVVNAVYELSSSRPLGSICKFQLNGTDVNISGTYYGYARDTSTGDIYSIYTNPNDGFLKSRAEMPAGTYNLTLIAKVSV